MEVWEVALFLFYSKTGVLFLYICEELCIAFLFSSPLQ